MHLHSFNLIYFHVITDKIIINNFVYYNISLHSVFLTQINNNACVIDALYVYFIIHMLPQNDATSI